jgi:hypothetical protein
MAVWYSLWSFVIFFPFWYVWIKKNLATLQQTSTFALNVRAILTFKELPKNGFMCCSLLYKFSEEKMSKY